MTLEKTHNGDLSTVLNLLFYDVYFENYLERITSLQLSKMQLSILKLLKYSGPLQVGVIGDILHISRAAASKNIDVLVKQGLVTRKIISRDRRKASVSIQKEGQRIVKDFEHICESKQNEALASFDKNERVQLSELLLKFIGSQLKLEEGFELTCPICNGCLRDDCILVDHNIKCLFQRP